jgi:transcriptional regulator with XRE-family HTH domain
LIDDSFVYRLASMSTFGENVRAELKKQKLSQRDLAESIGIRQPSIANILNGKTKNPKHAFLIAKRLGKTVEELMGDDTDLLADNGEDFRLERIKALVIQLDDRSLDKVYEYVETLAEAQMLKKANRPVSRSGSDSGSE